MVLGKLTTLRKRMREEFFSCLSSYTMLRMPETASQDIAAKLISFPTVAGTTAAVDNLYEYVESELALPELAFTYFERGGIRSQLVHRRDADPLTPALLLNGHIDVVPADESQFDPRIEGDRLYGRGAADMKGSAAAAISAFRQLHREHDNLNVALLFTSDEEMGGTNGAGYVLEEGLKPEFVVVVDGPQRDGFKITTKAKGGLWLKIEAVGVSGHASRPWLAESAMQKVMDAIRLIETHIGPLKPDNWSSTCSTAYISTPNTTPNVIPDRVEAVLDIRFTEATAPDPRALLHDLQEQVPDVTLSSMADVPLLQTDESHPLVQAFQKAASDTVEAEVPFVFNHAASDARYFGEQSVPTVVMGVLGDNWHSQDEWASLASIEDMSRTLVIFIEQNKASFAG